MNKFCGKCGAAFEKNSKFCGECGTSRSSPQTGEYCESCGEELTPEYAENYKLCLACREVNDNASTNIEKTPEKSETPNQQVVAVSQNNKKEKGSDIAEIANPLEIIGDLDKHQLLKILKSAKTEADKVEVELNKIIDSQEYIEEIIQNKIKHGKNGAAIWIPVIVVLIILIPAVSMVGIEVLSGIPSIIFILIIFMTSACPIWYYWKRNSLKNSIASEYQIMAAAENEAAAIMKKCKILPYFLGKYRTPIAIRTMMEYLINGQCDSWKECTHKYDEQLHWWVLEKNSAAALELQKYTAIMASDAARNSGVAAAASTISAVSSLLRWFW
ncbi:MAG: zinc ribbon domain-containing protein [Oscillospiraceae bacterium]|nr:zinc ribbon domain-containing protein [Oscillospiraceae bacterium]